jgi:hypothetical protein
MTGALRAGEVGLLLSTASGRFGNQRIGTQRERTAVDVDRSGLRRNTLGCPELDSIDREG